jgi:tRNA(Ile)-lysidine synthase
MAPRSPWPFGSGPALARPLLFATREETERYCRESGIEPRRDPTNDLPVATRNRVRGELMPVLRSFNPRIAQALDRFADAAAVDADLLDSMAAAEWARLAKVRPGAVAMEKSALGTLHPALARRLVLRAAASVGGRPSTLGAEHVAAVLAALSAHAAEVPLPGGRTAVVDSRVLTVYSGPPPTPARPGVVELPVPGRVRFGDYVLEARVVPVTRAARDEEETGASACLDADRVSGALIVRPRERGDRLRPFGLGGSKKVQDVLVDAKVPAEERDRVPIVTDDAGIAWVAGHCMDERVAAGPATKQVLRLRALRRGAKKQPRDVLTGPNKHATNDSARTILKKSQPKRRPYGDRDGPADKPRRRV